MINEMPFVEPGSPRGTFGMPSSAAASTCFARHARQVQHEGWERNVKLTEILEKEGT